MKPFTIIDEQIRILQRRGLIFSDVPKAKRCLKQYGYYEIINGYKDPFLAPAKIETYQTGATFEQIYSLFLLDKNIQYSVFKAMIDVERNLKAALSYAIAEQYGVNEVAYLNRNNYDSGNIRGRNRDGRDLFDIDITLEKLKMYAKSEHEPYLHYRMNHHHIPPWILLKEASFGDVYHFFKLQKSSIKEAVLQTMLDISSEEISLHDDPQSPIRNMFFDTIKLCYKYRNRSAHAGRIYNYRPKRIIKNSRKYKKGTLIEDTVRYNPALHNRMHISPSDYRAGYGQNDLFTLISSLSFLANQEIWIELARSLQTHLLEYNNPLIANQRTILKTMGIQDKYIDYFQAQQTLDSNANIFLEILTDT